LRGLCFGEGRVADKQSGRLFDKVGELRESENIIIAVTADHGEAFGEHDRFGHHIYPYDELVRVPLIISGKNVNNRVIDSQMQLLDLAPTLLDLVGADIPEAMEGQSVASHLGSDCQIEQQEPAMFISESGKTLALRTSKWKYILRSTTDNELLFDLESDSKEQNNVVSANRDVAERLRHAIQEYKESVDADVANIKWSDETRERLQNLGYIQQ
jgi:arylsulfatase A-like enzyme